MATLSSRSAPLLTIHHATIYGPAPASFPPSHDAWLTFLENELFADVEVSLKHDADIDMTGVVLMSSETLQSMKEHITTLEARLKTMEPQP